MGRGHVSGKGAYESVALGATSILVGYHHRLNQVAIVCEMLLEPLRRCLPHSVRESDGDRAWYEIRHPARSFAPPTLSHLRRGERSLCARVGAPVALRDAHLQ